MTTKNTALSILLIVQLAIIAFVYWPSSEQIAPKTTFFTDITIEQIQGLSITDDEQTSISMLVEDEFWQIQQGQYPAKQEGIEALLGKIIALQSARLVSTTTSSQVRLKVAEDLFSRKVDLQLADGTSKSFFLGTAPNNKTIHFRMKEQNEVYLVKDLASWEMQTDKESWWETNYITIAEDELEAVKITNPQGTITMQKGEEKEWLLAETTKAQVSQEEIQKLIRSISQISLAEYLGKEQPEDLGEPVCTLEYTSKSGHSSLTIWPADQENDQHIAKASNSDFYVTVRAYILKDLLAAQLSDFMDEEDLDDKK